MTKTQFKVSRRICENSVIFKKLTPKQNTIISKLKTKSNRKQSDFSRKLQHVKRLSVFYGNLAIHKIKHKRTNTYLDKLKSLLLNLETRLDVLLVRASFAPTIFTARQLIIHKKVCVNSQIIQCPGFHIANGDIISIAKHDTDFRKKPNRIIYTRAYHLEVNYKTFNAILLCEPSRIRFPYKIALDVI